jgi:hypothetical protein
MNLFASEKEHHQSASAKADAHPEHATIVTGLRARHGRRIGF